MRCPVLSRTGTTLFLWCLAIVKRPGPRSCAIVNGRAKPDFASLAASSVLVTNAWCGACFADNPLSRQSLQKAP